MKIIWTVWLGVMAMISSVQAASFDCEKVELGVERIICSDRELSGIDEILNAAYRRALVTSVDEPALRRAQQKWLKTRNACSNSECLKKIYEERIEWISKQHRVPIRYELVMSRDNAVCRQVLGAYNAHVEEEFPLPRPNFIRLYEDYPKHAPSEISPQWREGAEPGAWLTEIDLDWDGKNETVLKDWSLDGMIGRRERRNTGLDVMRGIVLAPATNFSARVPEMESTFPGGIPYTLSFGKSYPTGSFGKPQHDRGYSPAPGMEGIEATQFDVVIVKGKAYLTFVSNDLGEDFFEDWGRRKWRVIGRYSPEQGYTNELEDVCYLVLLRSSKK
jgi:uncharacterized protein